MIFESKFDIGQKVICLEKYGNCAKYSNVVIIEVIFKENKRTYRVSPCAGGVFPWYEDERNLCASRDYCYIWNVKEVLGSRV
jgi:hypothetical protein